MEDKLQQVNKILKDYNQQHLLYFYDELNDDQKSSLLDQILSIDFEKMKNLYDNSFKDTIISSNRISPIPYFSKSRLSNSDSSLYISLGENIIANSEVAVLTLAGGQGTRLGFNGPKGCYEIDVPPKKSLFEFTCDKLKNTFNKYKVYLPWYIMTSPSNNNVTISYFYKKNFFGYPKDKIYFFSQDVLPIIDKNGKIILDNIYSIKTASNGNGDVFRAFYSAGLVDTLEKNNIKWISVTGIDNILLDTIDPLFIGLATYNNSDIAAKSIAKSNLSDSDFIFAYVDNTANIIDPCFLSKEMLSQQNKDGLFCYNQINILSHLFTTNAFVSSVKLDLPYHRAFKKNNFINEEGMKVVPTSPNSFKFEKFIFDAFKYYKNFTLLEVEACNEFSPIKAFTGNATPETALALYLNKMNLN